MTTLITRFLQNNLFHFILRPDTVIKIVFYVLLPNVFFVLACHTNGLSTTQVPLRGKRVVYCYFIILWSMSMASPFIFNGELWGQITFSISTIRYNANLFWKVFVPKMWKRPLEEKYHELNEGFVLAYYLLLRHQKWFIQARKPCLYSEQI